MTEEKHHGEEKVIATVLTHNRKELLLQTLEGLLSQTRPLDRIIIVDSVSTDGTYDELKAKGILDRKAVKYERLDSNKGPSGGFAEGVTRSLAEGATWVWILDDDIVPKEDCLEELLEHKDISHLICPNREGKTVPFFNPAVGLTTHHKNLSYEYGKELVFANTGSFEGMLVHKEVVSKIGVPDERFFQVGGDMVYGFEASLYTNVLHVKEAFIHRLLPEKKPVNSRRAYLFMRNQFLVKEHLKKHGLFRAGLFYLVLTSLALHYAVVIAFKTRSPRMPFAVVKGLMHGMFGKFGAPK